MSEFELTQEKLEAYAKIIGGKAWGFEKRKPRLYMKVHRKDVQFYFDIVDDNCGYRAVVHIDDCGQHPHWYENQKLKVLQRFYKQSLALSAAQGDREDIAEQIMELDEQPKPEIVDKAAHEIANGRYDRALAILKGRKKFIHTFRSIEISKK